MNHMNISRSDVTILSPYRSQIACIKNLLLMSEELRNKNWLESVNTIDSYQGKECDIVIISLVRSNTKGLIGFLNDKNRMNVMLTRSKSVLIIIGDKSCLKTNKLWSDIIEC